MKSSAAVLGRAIVMLACIVGIPYVALCDASWSKMVKKLQEFQWSKFWDHDAVEKPVGLAASSSQPALLSLPAAPAHASGDRNARELTPITSSTRAVQSSVIPVGFQSSGERTPALPIGEAVCRNGGDTTDFGSDPYRTIQKRLREMGATYYLLESWGNDRQMYRFFCKMAIGGSRDYTRCFEATADEPLQAMRQVLEQVENQKKGIAGTP